MSRGPVLAPLRQAFDRAAFRRRLHQVAEGRAGRTTLDLGGSDAAAAMLADTCRMLPVGAPALYRVGVGLRLSGALQRTFDGLAARDRQEQLRSIKVVSALRLEAAVPWLEPILASPNVEMRAAAARALGRIGGLRAAEALARGIRWRRGSTARLAMELARAAPDHYVESLLATNDKPRLQGPLAIAAGLRRRQSAVIHLAALVESGSRSTRAAAAHALGSIGGSAAESALAGAALDPDTAVRNAAGRARARLERGAAAWR